MTAELNAALCPEACTATEDSNPCVAPATIADDTAACETSVTTCDTGSTHSRSDSPAHDRVPGDEGAALDHVVVLAAAGGCHTVTADESFAGLQQRIADSVLQLHEIVYAIEHECFFNGHDTVLPCQEAITRVEE